VTIDAYIRKLQKHALSIRPYVGSLPLEICHMKEPILEVEEQYIDPFKARAFFKDHLGKIFHRISNPSAFCSIDSILKECNKEYDLILNCTYNALTPIPCSHYELFVTLLYRIDSPELFAYTVMDGPFFSIYPYDITNRIYTVTSVVHGPIYKGTDTTYTLTESGLSSVRSKMNAQLLNYIPSWNEQATYVDYYTSWKTKHVSTTDDRSLRHSVDDRVVTFYGGKITGIFHAEKLLNTILDKHIKTV